MIQNRKYSRFKWSHDLWLHRVMVRIYNFLMTIVPFGIKYGIGKNLRKNKPPYFLIQSGSVVIQVGAPKDTLNAGRSRGMHFILFSKKTGTTIIVEPDQESISAYQRKCQRLGIDNAIFIPSAAWFETGTLRIYINDAHPASNFVEGTKIYNERRLQDFQVVEIPATSIDYMLEQNEITRVDLVSITTNGSEREILAGMKKTIAAGIPYISLARTGEGYQVMMDSIGYVFYAHDDRGFTFRQEKILSKQSLDKIL
ncbi:MAG: FkbM family methyltransferase [Anaerolineae bacterium]|nr:FkbM family methyltransferase [Anaerolineae bacterium]